MTSKGPTNADLTAMVQQLCLENRRLENQLAERKIEVEELRDDLRLLRRGLSAKMKRLFVATGHKELYLESLPKKGHYHRFSWALFLVGSFRFRLV